MKKILLLITLSIIFSNCTQISNLKQAHETVGKIELRYYKNNAINYTELALKSLDNYRQLKATTEKQHEEVVQVIEKAAGFTEKYYDSSSGVKADRLSSKKAMGYIRNAQINFKGGYTESTEVCLKLAVKYMLNDEIALWQYQSRGKHQFPDYLKWGSDPKQKQPPSTNSPDTLVFSGGGARGIAFAGVLKYFTSSGKINKVDRYIGVSAGSIISSFMSMGEYYEKHKKNGEPPFCELVYQIINNTDIFAFVDNPALRYMIEHNNYDIFREKPLSTIPDIVEALDTRYAICSGDVIEEFFKTSFERLGFDRNTTLLEHYEKTGKHLVLVACSLSYRRTAYFDYKTAPDMRLVDAILGSMAVPYVFKPLKYNNDFFIDGGIAINYPIDYFELNKPDSEYKPEMLGFVIFSEPEIFYPKWQPVSDPMKYALAVVKTAMLNSERLLFEKNRDKTICIDCGDVDIMNFNMSPEQKQMLMEAGYEATEKYFKQK